MLQYLHLAHDATFLCVVAMPGLGTVHAGGYDVDLGVGGAVGEPFVEDVVLADPVAPVIRICVQVSNNNIDTK